jgi:uncharacterized membrane protein YfcA
MTVSLLEMAVLFVAGAAGGALNSVAGGGSFIVFPTMLVLTGMGPVTANATTAVALWPAGLASIGPYRRHLPTDKRTLLIFSAMSLLGGGLGASLLLVTSDATFARILPGLMLAAASVFTFGPRFTKKKGLGDKDKKDKKGVEGFRLPLLLGAIIQLLISTYGGYFGGGMGIMMLATFTLIGMTHIHEMNALKVVLGLLINGVASASFLFARKAVLLVALPVALGSIFGGWAGAALASRVDPKYVRGLVLIVAWSLTVWFFYRSLRR